VSGAQLTDRARRQAGKFGAEVLTACHVTGMEVRGSGRVIRYEGGELSAHAVILATGVSYRPLDAPGVAGLTGTGIYYGSAATEASTCQDNDVYIVGGANAAGQAAVYFSRYARTVTILVRGDSLERSMSYYLIQQLAAIPTITVRTQTELAEAHGNGHLEAVTLHDRKDGMRITVPASHLFVFIGAEPHTDWLDDTVARDGRGFIYTGTDLLTGGQRPPGWDRDRDPLYLESSVPGIFAAGDVRANSVKRVASAVGEGAMAVTLVHRYLEGN
jgi:thioredoxin reductase (NADPH)